MKCLSRLGHFHAGNRGSNPLGDASKFSGLRVQRKPLFRLSTRSPHFRLRKSGILPLLLGELLEADDLPWTALSHDSFHRFLGLLETKGRQIPGRGLGALMTKDSLGHRHRLSLTVKKTRREVTDRVKPELPGPCVLAQSLHEMLTVGERLSQVLLAESMLLHIYAHVLGGNGTVLPPRHEDLLEPLHHGDRVRFQVASRALSRPKGNGIPCEIDVRSFESENFSAPCGEEKEHQQHAPVLPRSDLVDLPKHFATPARGAPRRSSR